MIYHLVTAYHAAIAALLSLGVYEVVVTWRAVTS